MSECKYRGTRLSVRVTNGKTISVFQCDQFGNCVKDRDDVSRTGVTNSCEGCESFVKLVQPPSYLTCVHRGETISEKLNCSCGNDKTIYGCAIFGRCTKRLPAGWNQEKLVELNPGVSVCRDCQSAE